jgi:hopanoid biosynthesis associated radical SAM protein HpnH
MLAQGKHRATMKLRGRRRYPSVLMLEPLYTCNLACIGCSKERHTGKLKDRIPLETIFRAVDDCEAPIVNLCGGEPTLYPELEELIGGLLARDKYIIFCTNALELETKLYGRIPPSDRLFLMVHLDGMRETHDYVCDRKGVFDKAVAAIRRGKELGYHVFLNTTVFKKTKVSEVQELCELVEQLRADGILVSPGYEYESVERDIFLTRDEIHSKFQQIRELSRRYKITATPAFLEFAAGLRELPCSPWSTVNYTPKGWKAPCYLVEGEGYFATWKEFFEGIDWEYWESRKDPRCANCKMHSGFEHSAVEAAMGSLRGKVRLAMWSLGL